MKRNGSLDRHRWRSSKPEPLLPLLEATTDIDPDALDRQRADVLARMADNAIAELDGQRQVLEREASDV